jgi:hypothetical protein
MNRFTKALAIAAVIIAPLVASAASWSDRFGMGAPGNAADDNTIGGSGAPLAVLPSVQSNSLYYVTSAKPIGAPRISKVWLNQDFIGGTVKFYVATNQWICASNQPAGTNIIWLTTTNNTLATNDFLVIRNVTTDGYQLMVCGGGSTDATSAVYSNSVGHVAIKVWNPPTNAIAPGDILYKLTVQQTYTPLAMGSVTNQLAAIPAVHFGDWVTLGQKENPISFAGRAGWPSAIVMTYSNTAALQVYGDYSAGRVPIR